MERKTRLLIGEIVWPFFAAFSFLGKAINSVLLAWWLGPLLQGRANRALQYDAQQSLLFLFTNGGFVKERRLRVLPFDYAEVCVELSNMRICLTRGRGELNISVSPSYLPLDNYQLAVVIAALDAKAITEVTVPTELTDLDALLRARFNDLNSAFSQTEYPRFKTKLLAIKDNVQILTRQAEWELNTRLGHHLRSRSLP